MLYEKSSTVQGGWAKAANIKSGTLVKLVSEATESAGEYGTQNVAKAKFRGSDEILNVRINKTTINGLIDAFGKDSKSWMDRVLTAVTEKAIVGGKRVTILYLVPEGFELREKDGYVGVVKIGADTKTDTPPPIEDNNEDVVNQEDIPF